MMRDPSPIRLPLSERLKRLAMSAWAISFVSFAVTALVIQAPGLPLV